MVLTRQFSIDCLHGQIAKLRPQDLQIVDANHGEITKINESHCHGVLVEHGVDSDAIPHLVRVVGHEELVLLEVRLRHGTAVVILGVECIQLYLELLQLHTLTPRLNL